MQSGAAPCTIPARSEAVEASVHFALVEAEVLPRHAQGQVHHVVSPQQFDGLLPADRGELRGIHHGRIADLQVDLCTGAECGCGGRRDTVDRLPEIGCRGFIVGAQGAIEHDLVRNDVAGVSPTHHADGEHGGLRGVAGTADHRLQCRDDVGRCHHGVGCAVRQRRVAAASDNADAEFVGSRHVGTAAEAHHPGVELGIDVLTDNAVHERPVGGPRTGRRGVGAQGAFLHENRCTARQGFLTGLEHAMHRAGPMLARGLECGDGPEEAGRMRIVATGVHHSGYLTGMGPVHFLNGQGVHVGPERHSPGAGFGSLHFCDDAGRTAFTAPTRGEGDAHVLQLRGDIGPGFGLSKGRFRMQVKVPTVPDDLFAVGFDGGEQGGFQHGHRSKLFIGPTGLSRHPKPCAQRHTA